MKTNDYSIFVTLGSVAVHSITVSVFWSIIRIKWDSIFTTSINACGIITWVVSPVRWHTVPCPHVRDGRGICNTLTINNWCESFVYVAVFIRPTSKWKNYRITQRQKHHYVIVTYEKSLYYGPLQCYYGLKVIINVHITIITAAVMGIRNGYVVQ